MTPQATTSPGAMTELGILDLLGLAGLDRSQRITMVRHLDKRYDTHGLLRNGWLEAYQAFQHKPVFRKTDILLSFVGLENRRARFFGAFRVGRELSSQKGNLPVGCPHAEWLKVGYFYDLQRLPEFALFEHRAVIDWGPAAIVWRQSARNKPVTELLPAGQLLRPFADYLDFTLSFSELRYLHEHPQANFEWRARLSAVAGIYLILDSLSGRQYVGSAYGKDGVWGRWAAYAKSGHGGNAALRRLAKRPGYPAAFTFSLLQVMPPTTTKAAMLELERRFKQKLGTLATGLNQN